jgi:acetyl-CoA carboxylase beta subunit
VDMVVTRHEMKATVSRIARILMKQQSTAAPSTALVPA